MYILFEIIKAMFFFLSIVIGIFLVRGDKIMDMATYTLTKQIAMPGYLIFCGLIVGYIIANIQTGATEDKVKKNSIYTKAFIIGIFVGLVLAISYIFM